MERRGLELYASRLHEMNDTGWIPLMRAKSVNSDLIDVESTVSLIKLHIESLLKYLDNEAQEGSEGEFESYQHFNTE